mmetsp:Transcript_20352/g.45272  ORF Transcript_20352/g.45272 Transcript_20352/m.45272 type:complete len:349 (+) Transcript_20352:91-1137(+)
MNSFDLVFSELQKNSNGMTVNLKRKTKNGDLIDAKPNELASLGTKSTVASTAGLLAKLNPTEKLEWAIETKNEANEFYAEQEFEQAMIKYVECLAATDFGKAGAEREGGAGNVDTMVVPVLCNLAACCLQLGQWSKAASFGEQATLLRPHCSKAQLRMGLGLLRMGEFDLALGRFNCAQQSAEKACAMRAAETAEAGKAEAEVVEVGAEIVSESVGGDSLERKEGAGDRVDSGECPSFLLLAELSTADWQRLPLLVRQAKRGQRQQRGHVSKQKQALQRAFAKSSARSDPPPIDYSSDEDEADTVNVPSSDKVDIPGEPELMTLSEAFRFFLSLLLNYLRSLFKAKGS